MSQTLAKTQAAKETEKVKEKIRLQKIKEDKEKAEALFEWARLNMEPGFKSEHLH